MTPERENEIAYAVGLILGRIMRAIIVLAGLFGLCLTIAASGNAEPRQPAPVVKPTIAHKPPVKKPAKKAKKKCACDCKKVVDKPVEPVYIVIIENAKEEGQESDQIVL